MTSWTAKVVNIVQTTSSVKSFTVDVGKNFDFKPGQYLDIFPSSDVLAKLGPKYTALEVVTGYSMTSSPLHTQRTGCLELSIKKTTHPVTQMLHEDVKIGDEITVAGPGGSFFYLKDVPDAPEHVVLIGGGIGATPLLSMLHYVAEECDPNTTHVTYLCSVRNIDEALHVSQIEDLAKNHSNIRAIFTVTNEDNSNNEVNNKVMNNGPRLLIENGRVTGDKIKQIVTTAEKDFAENPNRKTKYFLCGPKTMVNDIKNILINELKVSPEVVFHESWS
jgi:ferredoxin-NADP reductase